MSKAEMMVLQLFTVELCPFCETETVIYSTGVTACPECGKPIVPCSECDGCDYDTCPYGCDGTENDEYLVVTNPPITKERAEYIHKYL